MRDRPRRSSEARATAAGRRRERGLVEVLRRAARGAAVGRPVTPDSRIAVVTGSASGIGRATVARFVAAGWSVIGLDLHDADVVGDVSEESTWKALTERVERLDALINNAGINVRGTVEDLDLQTWERIIAVNLTSAFLGAKHCLPLLKQSHGSIVNVSSGAGLVGVPRGPAYAASKGGLIALTRQLAIDYAADGVRVNAVCPGVVDTPLVRQLASGEADVELELTRMAAAQPLGRLGAADEIAAIIYVLASEQASFVTGAILPIDGGYTAR